MSAPDDDPMPGHVLRDALTLLEPYREQVEPLLCAAAEADNRYPAVEAARLCGNVSQREGPVRTSGGCSRAGAGSRATIRRTGSAASRRAYGDGSL